VVLGGGGSDRRAGLGGSEALVHEATRVGRW
jgi:hypothetical protein